MNEQRRTQYLEAMGLDSYVPRWRLPNALSPVACELACESVPAHDEPPAPSSPLRTQAQSNAAALSTGQARSLSHALSDVLADLGGAKPRPKAPSEPAFNAAPKTTHTTAHPAVAEAGLQQDAEPHSDDKTVDAEPAREVTVPESADAKFHLGLWFTDTGIQIVDSRQRGDALPIEVFLSNLLVSNGLIHRALPPMETQSWPFPGASEAERTWSAACSMLSDFFQARFHQSPARAILVFGEEAAKGILGEDIVFSELCFSSQNAVGYPMPVYVLPALRAFLYHPELKREVWAALAPLRAQEP